MFAIILAGGEGTRLRPLTYTIPKALIPVQGRTLTEQALDIYKNINIKDFYLSISYLADQMVEYFGNGEKFDCKIDYLKEDKAMGTAGPLIILQKTNRLPKQDFLMSNGDNLFALDLLEMIQRHQKNDAVATISLVEVVDTTQVGIARLEGEKILEFIEKPALADAPSRYANSGYYIISPKIFDYLPNKDFIMLEKDVFPEIAKAGKLFGYQSNAQWFDTGTPERYAQVQREWAGPFKYKN